MNPSDPKIRFDELSAGRAFGDLSLEEERELDALCLKLGVLPDESLEALAAQLEIEARLAHPEPMPETLSRRLHQWVAASRPAAPSGLIRPQVSAWRRVLAHPLAGWAAAAAAIAFAWISPRGETSFSPSVAENLLRSNANDLIERRFSGLGDFQQAAGTVLWSDSLQQGIMKLTGIPANDPSKAQYQLWIVDPKRDADAPVDGGVFDIPAGNASVTVPISAKLTLSNPKAFVITLEQPGGVVKSKQEKVVALAKNG